ncbi:MAG TPA: glucosamine-6-phosphate deaminase [Puia sp.]|nr:glucosamine-6-phosphate deaminase [Puia sp.]
MMKSFRIDKLAVRVYDNRSTLGSDAAMLLKQKIEALLAAQSEVNIIFAAAPSQNEFLSAFKAASVDWKSINAFHMDEYIGLADDASQGFGNFLRQRLFDDLPFHAVHLLNGNAGDPVAECKRYTSLLTKHRPDIVCLGIGENTHLAFNDPHIADFKDPEMVKVVSLDEQSRRQQVNDGCFERLDQVPTQALTLTIPAMFGAGYLQAVVPGPRKAMAVFHTLCDQVDELYPSTILRTHRDATLFLDRESAGRIKQMS